MSEGLKNYGLLRGQNPRKFLIGDEIFTVKKLPARIHLEFTAWRVQYALPKPPAIIQEDDQNEYRIDFRDEDGMLMDLAIMTLNASRTPEQTFEVDKDWLLENVSGDHLEELVQDVMDPFLEHLKEKEIHQKQVANQMMVESVGPMLKKLIQEEIQTNSSNTSAKSSSKRQPIQDGQQNTVLTT